MHKQIYTFLFLFASTIAIAQKQNPIGLKEGQDIKVTASMDQTTEMGMGMTMKMNTKSTAQMKVEKVTDNGVMLSNKVTRVVTDIDAMGQSQSFDSDKKEDLDSETGEALKDILDAQNFFMVDRSTGKFTAVDKDGKILAEDKAGNSESMMQMGAGAMNDASHMKSFVTVLPVNVKPGYSWTDSTNVNGIRTKTINTVARIENNTAYIDITGTTAGSTSMSMQEQNFDVTMNGTFTGKSEVNTKTNLTKMQNITTDISSSIDMMGQTMNMTTKGTTTMMFE